MTSTLEISSVSLSSMVMVTLSVPGSQPTFWVTPCCPFMYAVKTSSLFVLLVVHVVSWSAV